MSIRDFFTTEGPKASEVVSNLHSKFLTERENEEVVKSLHTVSSKKRRKYKIWTIEQKLEIGSYVIRHGISSTVSHYSKEYPGISKQSICEFKRVRYFLTCLVSWEIEYWEMNDIFFNSIENKGMYWSIKLFFNTDLIPDFTETMENCYSPL